MSTLFLSCALLLTTSILAHRYGHSTPLWHGSASVRFAVPADHMLAYFRTQLLCYAKGMPDYGFSERNNDC
jgi:hypothetical protein